MIKTKVCIVGVGPAGAATSLMLSKHQISHYCIDKAIFPRDKTCGDGLILYAYKSLKLLDEELFQAFLHHPKILHSKKINLHINDQLKITFQESEERDMVISYAKRIDFDQFLVSHAQEKEYATFEFGNAVKSFEEREDGVLVKLKDGKEILASMVVGADGIQSIVSKKLAKNSVDRKTTSTFVSAYFSGVKDVDTYQEAEVRLQYKNMPLFFYIFPLSDGTVNISLGGNAEQIQQYNIHLIDEIENIIKTHPKVAYRFADAKQESKWRGWGIPYGFNDLTLSGDRFLLVGDAAGLANPFYKEGVGTGMMSGIICANKIAECLQKKNFTNENLSDYPKLLEQEFGKLLNYSGKALKLAKHQRIFALAAKVSKGFVEKKSYSMIEKRSY